MDAIKQFQEIDDSFNESLLSNDSLEVSKYLHDNWILIEGQYGIITRARFLNSIATGNLTHTSMKKEVLRVDVHDDMVIVNSRGMNVGTLNGVVFNSEQWVTSVYKSSGARWLCVVTHETPVSC